MKLWPFSRRGAGSTVIDPLDGDLPGLTRANRERAESLAALQRTVAQQVELLTKSVETRGKLFAANSYKGASQEDTRSSWNPAAMSPDDTAVGELDRLVSRQRDLVRNSPWARALYEQMRSYVCGSQPWSVQPAARPEILARFGISEAQTQDWVARCDELFEESAADTGFDRQQCCDLWELMRRAYGLRLDFDGLARIHVDATSPAGVSVSLIEGDLVRTPPDKANDPLVRFGVRHDKKTGEPWAFYIADRYPLSLTHGQTAQFDFVKRYDAAGRQQLIHLMRPDRVGQSRGLPWLHAVLGELDDLAAFAEAELMAARVSACIGLIIQSSNPLTKDSKGNEKLKLKPGAHLRVGSDTQVTAFNPTRPSSSFEPFVRWRQRDVCSSLGFSSTLGTRDFERANYSVSRTILFDAKRTFEAEQRWLASTFLRPIYRRFIEQAWLDGKLPPLPLYDGVRETQITSELLRCTFTAPPYGFVDPLTEVDAIGKALGYRLIDYKDAIGQLGKDASIVHRNLAQQVKGLREAGIAPEGDAPPQEAPAGAPVMEQPAEEAIPQ